MVASWKTYNLNVAHFENTLHRLFDQARFQVKIYHDSGAVIVPKEWFIVPLPIIQKAVQCIIEGIPISYDQQKQTLQEHRHEQFITYIDKSKLKILVLNIKEVNAREIIKGQKTEERVRIKSSTVNKCTYIDHVDNKRWIRPYDSIKFNVVDGRGSILMRISDIQLERDKNSMIYVLGEVLEHNIE